MNRCKGVISETLGVKSDGTVRFCLSLSVTWVQLTDDRYRFHGKSDRVAPRVISSETTGEHLAVIG